MTEHTVSRRTLFKALGAGGLVATAPALLAGCGSGGEAPAGTGGAQAPLPTFAAVSRATPDLPAGSEAVTDVYLSYPGQLTAATTAKPGDGSTVRFMLDTTAPPPVPMGQNAWWQALNAALGVTLELNLTPSDQYGDKFAVVMAGGDLPDLMFIDAFSFPPRFEDFVASQCHNLSELIAGDNIAQYPNLAGLPTYAWRALGRFGDGGLYSVPVARTLISNTLMVNRALLADGGQWTREAFAGALRGVSSGSRWGLAHSPFWHDAIHSAAHGAPNLWRVDGGQFTSAYATGEYRAALEFARELWQTGAYHPDSLSLTSAQKQTLFVNQTLAGNADGVTAAAPLATRIKGAFALDFAAPYQVSGVTSGWFTGAGAFGRILLKKTTKERAAMLLRLLDYLAAPFGSREYELIRYGVEGTHFTRGEAGQPVKTDAANAQNPGIVKISGGVPPYEGWLSPDIARRLHAWQTELAPRALKDPAKSNGLRSATASKSGATLDNLVKDAVNAVVTGQKPVSHWDDTVKKWRADGGDKIAEEYAASLASQP